MSARLNRPRYSLHDYAIRRLHGTLLDAVTGERVGPFDQQQGALKVPPGPAQFDPNFSVVVATGFTPGGMPFVKRRYARNLAQRRASRIPLPLTERSGYKDWKAALAHADGNKCGREGCKKCK